MSGFRMRGRILRQRGARNAEAMSPGMVRAYPSPMGTPAKSNSTGKAGANPWWLDVGEEDCPHCDHTYSYEAELRCFECDAPICPMCVVRVQEKIVCPNCQAAKVK